MIAVNIIVTLAMLLALVYATYYLSGYTKSRRLEKKPNRLHAWGSGQKILGFVNGDDSNLPKFIENIPLLASLLRFLVAYVSLPPPYKRVLFTIVYTEISTDGKTTAFEKPNDRGGMTRYGVPQAIAMNDSTISIREVTDDVYNYRRTEIHPFFFSIIFPCGLTFYLVIETRIKISDPMKTLALNNPLRYAQKELRDPLGNWTVKQQDIWVEEAIKNGALEEKDKKDQNQGAIQRLVIKKMLEMNIDKPEAVTIIDPVTSEPKNLKLYLNEKIKEYGMRLRSFSMQLGFSPAIKKMLTEMEALSGLDIALETQKKKNKIEQESLEQKKRNWKQLGEKKIGRLEEVLIGANRAIGEGGLKFYSSGGDGGGNTALVAALIEEIKEEKRKDEK